MRETRRDPTTGLWSVLSTERVHRPVHLEPRRMPEVPPERCPFCPGNEHATAHPITAVERDGAWSTRVVANKYPALGLEEKLEGRARGPWDQATGFGVHEVVIEGREHHEPLWRQPLEQTVEAMIVARERMRDLTGDRRIAYLCWFRNHGQECGASQPHPHAQLVGSGLVPSLVGEMTRRAVQHRQRRGRDLMQDVVDYERDERVRVVWEDEHVVALCPFAPAAPFEVWVVPTRGQQAHYRKAGDAVVRSLAEASWRVSGRIARELEDPPHNVVLYTAPQPLADDAGFRWHVRIRPKLEPGGGFEEGTGAAIVSVLPEEAARLLRKP